MAIAITCPICNQTTSGNFCEHCGFEIHILPNDISPEVEAYERERERKYKERMEELSGQASSSQEELDKFRKETEKKAQSAQAMIDKLTEDLKLQTHNLNKAQKTTEELQGKNQQLESEMKSQIETLKAELVKARTENANAKLDGIVRIAKKDASGGVVGECYLPVYKGLNTYGTESDQQKTHHTIGLRRTPIAKKHFSIEKNPSGQMILRPLNGENITCDGRAVPETGMAVEIHHRINISSSIDIQVASL